MMDPQQLMKMAQMFSGPASAPVDSIGPRITLAILASVENRDCRCETCEHLRAIVQVMREQARAAMGPRDASSVPVM